MTYADLVSEALSVLEDDDELFCDMIDELDRWNGFADGYAAWPMEELDDICYGMKLSDFLSKIVKDSFDLSDNYFYWSIYGLESTDDKAEHYRDHTSSGEVLDEIIDNYNHLFFSDMDFKNLIEQIIDNKERR